jgi:ABC-type transport system involved in multi-copper enzyme maturation permease subunit
MNCSLTRQMIGAELLKLRRNRGTMAFALFLTVGVVILFFGVSAIAHASNPARNEPAGGMHGFRDGVHALGVFFGMLAGILIGSEAGTSDRASGVFRDLVVTGRSRLALFAVRLPAAMIISLAFSACAYAVILIGTFAFAGGTGTPSLGLILQGAGWIALANIAVVTLAVGIGSLTGSRAVTLTAVIGWQAIATNILLNISFLGSARDGLLTAGLNQLIPVSGDHQTVTMGTGVAIVVILCWLVIPTLIGAWRTETQDA